MKISFIGYGNMARAIARGLIAEDRYTLAAAAPSLTKGLSNDEVQTYTNNIEAIKDAEIIILAVKPASMAPVLKEILPHLTSQCLVISVAAGLSLDWFKQHGCEDLALIRTMPNTPAAIGLAATPMIANSNTTEEQKHWAERIFKSIGLTTWVNYEEDMDSFTALSGSGPAYVFSFIDAMIKAGTSMGLEESVVKTFTLQTIKGSFKLAQESDLSLNQLRTKVTSPGGTTAAALDVIDNKLDELILSAMRAAKKRSKELGSI